MKLPSSQKGFAPVFLFLAFAILVFVGVGGLYFYNNSTRSKVQDMATNPETIVDISKQTAEYKSGTEVGNLGFKLIIPAGWQVNYKDCSNSSDETMICFDYAPPGWKIPDGYSEDYMGWGGYRVDIYPKTISVEDFYNKFLTSEDTKEYYDSPNITKATVSKQEGYKITTRPSKEGEESHVPISSYDIVLGKEYSYLISWAVQDSAVTNYSEYDNLEKPYFVFD